MKHEKYYLNVQTVNEVGKEVKQQVEVSEKIFREYKTSIWKEEAQWKRDHNHQDTKEEKEIPVEKRYSFDYNPMPKNVSLDSVMDAGGEGNLPYEPDFADEIIKTIEDAEILQILSVALEDLTVEEKDLYQHLFIENISEREYERLYGVPRKTVSYRKQKMLERLKNVINNHLK